MPLTDADAAVIEMHQRDEKAPKEEVVGETPPNTENTNENPPVEIAQSSANNVPTDIPTIVISDEAPSRIETPSIVEDEKSPSIIIDEAPSNLPETLPVEEGTECVPPGSATNKKELEDDSAAPPSGAEGESPQVEKVSPPYVAEETSPPPVAEEANPLPAEPQVTTETATTE